MTDPSKHQLTCGDDTILSPELAQQLAEEKNQYYQQTNKMKNAISNNEPSDVYIISTKFLKEWKLFTSYTEADLNQTALRAISPGKMNADLITQELSFREALIREDRKQYEDYEVVSQDFAKVFTRYQGNPIHRKSILSNGLWKVDEHIKISFFFFSQSWMNISYKNPYAPVPTYTCLAYKCESVKDILTRLLAYSRENPNNKQDTDARMWICGSDLPLKEYCSMVKKYIKKNPGTKMMKAPGTLVEAGRLVQQTDIGLFLLAIQLQGNAWVYNDQDSDNPHLLSTGPSTAQLPNVSQIQLNICNYCQLAKSLAFKCSNCDTRNYCSEACRASDSVFHSKLCNAPEIEDNPITNHIQPVSNPGEVSATASWKISGLSSWKTNYNDQSSKGFGKKGVVGLRNIGNTCYMNSALQCLSHTEVLTKYFIDGIYTQEINLENPIGSKGKLANEYTNFLKSLWSGNVNSFTPSDLKVTCGEIQPMFEGYQQHDSQQFLFFILDALHQDLNRILKKPVTDPVESKGRPDEIVARESWMAHLKRNRSVIYDLFGGQFKSRVTCPNCNLNSLTFDPYLYIPVPIPEDGAQQIILYFFYNNYEKEAKKITIACITNSLTELFVALEKVTEIPEARIKLIVSGFNGMVREVAGNDTIKRLINEKNLSEDSEEKQLFAVEYDTIELEGTMIVQEAKEPYLKPRKSFLIFKFVNAAGKAVHFKKMFPFQVDEGLLGKQLYDRICKAISKAWAPSMSQKQLRMKVENGEGFRIIARYGGMKVTKNHVDFKNQEEIMENSKVFQRIKQYNGQIEFQVRILTHQKMNFNTYRTHKENDHNPKFKSTTEFTLQECIKHFALTQILQEGNEWFCPECEEFVIAEKQMQIYKCPRLLIFQLKRFKQKGFTKVKNDAKIMYSAELDMKPFANSHTLPEIYMKESKEAAQTSEIAINEIEKQRKIIESDGCTYELYAVVNHYGSLQGGHYTSKAKNNGKWYNFNDDYVSELSNSEIQDSAAYLLFYKLKVE